MAYTSFAAVLCLSLSAVSGRGLVGWEGPGVGSMVVAAAEDLRLVTADEHNGKQKQRVNGAIRPFSHPAASGLAELVHRMTLFSHALNQSKDEHTGGDEHERMGEGLADLVQRMTLFSHALNLSTTEPLHGNSDELRVFEGLVSLMKRMMLFSYAVNLSNAEPEGSSGEQRMKEGLMDLMHRMTLFSHSLNLPSAVTEGSNKDQRVKEGLANLVDMMTLFSYALNRSSNGSTGDGDGGGEEKVSEGLAYLVDRMTLFSYALNQSSDESTGGGNDGNKERMREGLGELMHRMILFSQAVNMSNSEPRSYSGSGGKEQRVNEGLTEVVGRMRLLSEAMMGDHIQLLRSPAKTTDLEPREQPCLPPFQLIAYRMCIFQEMQLKLSWGDAQEFCRERGVKLVEDMVVIKTRKFLNDLYGEDGTRARWRVWVGGRRAGQTWIWGGGQQVPEFLWAPSEPREFSSYLAPEGQCMMLDGYRRFYGASSPCHQRRRFVCQLGN